MKILSVRAKHDGVGHYRISIPALALRERGHTVDILDSQPTMRACNAWFAGYDFCILQRCSDIGWIELIRTIPKEHRPIIVYECDDLITKLDKTNPCYKLYEDNIDNHIECIKASDFLVCSTDALLEELSGLNANAAVVPNCLDIPGYRNWVHAEQRSTSPETIVIGWLGGVNHVGDEEPMAWAIREVLRDTPNALFAFCGNPDLEKMWKASIRPPEGQWMSLRPDEFDGYQTRISQFDIGVAPLMKTPFNRCKSDLRLLEYGAWGVPYVASNIDPYKRFHISSREVGGFLAKSHDQWYTRLMHLVNREDERKWMGSELRNWIYENRGLASCGILWEDALQSLWSKPNRV